MVLLNGDYENLHADECVAHMSFKKHCRFSGQDQVFFLHTPQMISFQNGSQQQQ